ncbi:hypothetical protein ACS0TY_021774 [Phlomoides rotata]
MKRDNLREEGIFLIRDFEVFRSGIHYKITDHDYMIRFTDATTLEETVEENFLIPSEKFHLHSHSDLLSLMDKIDVLPDMISFLCKVDTHAPSGANQSKRVILHICMEEGINLRLTIWDALADSFATKFREIDERNIVIIATRKLCLSASSSTKIYLNGDFEVVKDFRTRHNVHPEIEDGESKNNDPNEYSIPEILSFISHEKEQGEDTVQDGRDRAPTSVLNIVGKTYKFQVKVTPYNFRAKYQSFTVSRIMNITDPTTEEHLQKKISVIEEAESSSSPILGKIKIEGVGE